MKTQSTLLLLWLCGLPLWSQSVNLPMIHQGYAFLERMEARGVLTDLRDNVRPFPRSKFASYLVQIDRFDRANPDALSPVEKDQLERLKGVFCDKLADMDVAVSPNQKEPHLYSLVGSFGHMYLDGLAGGDATSRSKGAEKSERRVNVLYCGAAMRGDLWGIGFYSDNRITTEWGTRTYVENYTVSEGYPQNAERDSSRAIWDSSDSYLAFSIRGFRFQFGRDRVRWGPSCFDGLMFSGLAPSFDFFKITTGFGPVAFTWLHGSLMSDFADKWVAAHRLDVSLFRGVVIGLSESVVYGNRKMEAAYLNPVMPYLFAEHTLGDKDNVSLGLDAKVNRIRNLKLYAEIFIDDLFAPWEIFSDFYGNKLAFSFGGMWVDPMGIPDSDLRFGYTRIEPYVYTHDDTVNVYENYNIGLGPALHPNSDEWRFRFQKQFSLKCTSSLFWQSQRHGEGDRRTPHRFEDGEEKHFLDGIIEKKQRWGGNVRLEIFRDCWLRLEAAHVLVKNNDQIENADLNWNEWVLTFDMNW